MTVPSAVVASTICLPLLDAPRRELTVAHRGSTAWQLADISGRVVACVSTPDAVRLPHTLIVPSLPPTPPALAIGQGALWWGEARVSVARWFAPPRPRRLTLQALQHPDNVADPL
ncbi:MAG: hypothetical protein ACRDQA_30785, partial [Nocardioidaceae bacterium]